MNFPPVTKNESGNTFTFTHFSCPEMYAVLVNRPQIITKISTWHKYSTFGYIYTCMENEMNGGKGWWGRVHHLRRF